MPENDNAVGIEMPSAIRTSIDSSFIDGAPMMVSYRSDKGRAETSYRGSTHSHSASEIAIWVRNRTGGLQSAAERGQRITIVYRNPRRPAFVNLQGTGRLVTDDETNRQIYDGSIPFERAQDKNRQGVGIIVTIERIAGSLDGGKLMLGA